MSVTSVPAQTDRGKNNAPHFTVSLLIMLPVSGILHPYMVLTGVTPRDILEFLSRKAYFGFPRLVEFYQHVKVKRLSAKTQESKWDPAKVLEVLEKNIPLGKDILLINSTAGLGPSVNPLEVLKFFVKFCEDRNVTLLLPSFPRLKKDPDGVLVYDPRTSVGTAGIISELARRSPGFNRSMFPFASAIAKGPKADWYLENNLNDRKPMPHGPDSPYAKLAESDGYVVSLGVSYKHASILVHVHEEVLDKNFPFNLEFDEIPVRVIINQKPQLFIVRRRVDSARPYYSARRWWKELPALGIVIPNEVNGINVDISSAKRVVQYMMARGLETGYPYQFLPRKKTAVPVTKNDNPFLCDNPFLRQPL